VHGGLNLYNNGFAAGIVASILAPIIIAIQSRQGPVPGSEGNKGTRADARKEGQA
jgi:hypothetical protein